VEKVVDKINRWIKGRLERINRKRLFYIVLPGILFLSLFTYLFLRNNTFYAGFSSKDYDNQQEEIVISRGIDSSRERISTGILIQEVKYLSRINDLRSKLRIGFWSKNNWDNLAEILPVVESGEFLYKIGRMKLGIEKLIYALKDEDSWAVESLVRLGAWRAFELLQEKDFGKVPGLTNSLLNDPIVSLCDEQVIFFVINTADIV